MAVLYEAKELEDKLTGLITDIKGIVDQQRRAPGDLYEVLSIFEDLAQRAVPMPLRNFHAEWAHFQKKKAYNDRAKLKQRKRRGGARQTSYKPNYQPPPAPEATTDQPIMPENCIICHFPLGNEPTKYWAETYVHAKCAKQYSD